MMENDEILHKWIESKLTEDELHLFKQRAEYESLSRLMDETEELNIPAWDKQTVLKNILQQKKSAPIRTLPNRNLWKYASVAAAALLLVAAFIFWPSSELVQQLAEQGEMIEGVLPDESTYVLNAESEIVFDEKKWSKNRKLSLKGEAYFQVQKGTSFLVETEDGSVQVLGTHFNVRSRNGILEVSCQEGKVGVRNLEGTQLLALMANDVARIESGKVIATWQGNGENEAGWVNGVFKFRNTQLNAVLDEIKRQFKVQITQRNIDSKALITCNFQNDNLENALKTTLTPLGINFEIKENQQVEIFK